MMHCIVRKKDNRIMHINGSIYGVMQRDDPEYECIPIPDQDVSHLYYDHPEIGWATREAYYPDAITPYTPEEQAALIDRDTGKAIDEAVHPFAGLQEEIGILRADLAALHVQLGSEPTEDFERLNAIATEKILEGQKKKEKEIDAQNS